jgi:hypothetical protein
MNESKWIKGAVNPEHKGYCTPMSKKTCTPERKALARRFKKGGDLHHESSSMNNIDQKKIDEAIASVNLRNPDSIKAAANAILTEDLYVNAGETVGIIDDPTYAQPGLKARVIGQSNKGSGWVDVELPNGVKIPVQSSLLLKIS